MGDRMCQVIDVTGDTSYPTGGSSLTPAQLQMSEIHLLDPQPPLSGLRLYKYDYTNKALKAFSAFGTEVANTTNLTADTIRCFVVGKGFPLTGPNG